MVDKTFGQTKVILTKGMYSIKSKLSGYIHNDTTDRSKMKVWILPQTRIVYCADIKHYADGSTLYSVELDNKSLLREIDVSVDKLYEVINNFSKTCNASSILIDINYNIFAYAFEKDNYLPHIDYDNIIKQELTVMTVAPLIEDIKNNEDYLIIVIGDLIKLVDMYTINSLIFLAIKGYVESRFPVIEEEKMKNSRIISFQAFSFLFYHIKTLLHTKEVYRETIKLGYETMSKMNFLPKVPSENWYVSEFNKDLKVDRLKQFSKKKVTMFEKILKGKDKNKENKCNVKNPFVPNYFSHLFDEKSPVIFWKDFVETMQSFDFESLLPQSRYAQQLANNDYYITPVIIIPDADIVDLTPNDICFMGYDGEDLHIVINSNEFTDKETPEEVTLKEKIKRNIHIKFGLTTDVTFDTYKISQKRLDLLEE